MADLKRRQVLESMGLGAVSLTLLSCGSTPVSNSVLSSPSAPTTASAEFYPPPPLPPRIQHLTTFTGEADVANDVSSFTRFIVGDETPDAQHLLQPYGVDMYAGKLYVVDTALQGMVVFDVANKGFSTVAGSGGGRMQRPINVTIDGDGTKYVCDTGRNQVLVFGPDDQFITGFGAEGQFKPVDCVAVGEQLYVVDIEHHQVQILNKHTGKRLSQFGKAGSATGELFHPTNIAVGPSGDIFVVETSNFRVQRFSPSGEPVRSYGRIGDGPGTFARPKGIAIDREERLYVGDAAFENIQVFNADGQLLLSFGQSGVPAHSLNLPAGIAINYAGAKNFQRYAAAGFTLEYVILVASQFGPNKVDVFGFGAQAGADYSGASDGTNRSTTEAHIDSRRTPPKGIDRTRFAS